MPEIKFWLDYPEWSQINKVKQANAKTWKDLMLIGYNAILRGKGVKDGNAKRKPSKRRSCKRKRVR